MSFLPRRRHPISSPAATRLAACLLASALVLHAEEPAPEEPARAYPVRVVRPLKVGSVFSYAALGSTHEHTLVTWSGGTLDEVRKFHQCELAATAEIVAVDAAGMPVRTHYRVHRCKGRDGERRESELVAKDTVIEVFVDALGLHFRIDGQPITQELHASLSLVLAKPVPDDEGLFGSAKPRRPGESWPVDSVLAAKRFADNGITVDPARLGALVTFEEIAPPAAGNAGESGECMVLAVAMKAADAGPELPAGFRVRTGSLEVSLVGRFPLDPALPPLDEESEFILLTDARGDADGVPLDLRVEITRTFRARRILFTAP